MAGARELREAGEALPGGGELHGRLLLAQNAAHGRLEPHTGAASRLPHGQSAALSEEQSSGLPATPLGLRGQRVFAAGAKG